MSSRKVNLPKLQLPKFDGDPLKWTTFHDAFISSVHEDKNLEEIHKFQYLVGQLTGEAAHAIEGLQLTNANYSEALDILQERFGKPHKVIAAYMKAMWELPKPNTTMNSLKEFHDRMESYIRGLHSLGKTEDSYGDLLVPIIFEKLPGRVKTQITREHGDSAWTLGESKAALYKEIQAAQAGTVFTEDIEEKNEYPSSAGAFHITAKREKMCAYCKGSHYSTDCFKISDKKRRLEYAQQNKLCFNCLKGRHSVRECLSKGRCRNCKRKHHTSLCEDKSQLRKSTETKDTPKPGKEKTEEETHVKLTPTSFTQSGPVLLKTTRATILANNHSIMANILIDEGSQRTFITKETIEKLNIYSNECATEDISLATFGADSTNKRSISVAEIQLQTLDGSYVSLSALVVPRISTPVKNYVQASVLHHSYLQGLPLANHIEKDTFEIDLLIGADYYWTLIRDHVVRGPGPTAVASRLGYLLSGPTHMNNVSVMNTQIYKVLVNTDEEMNDISNYWKLETIGIKDEPMFEIEQFENYRDKYLRKENDKYIAGLPWKIDHPPLPTNFDVCERKTRAMVRRLPPELLAVYNRIITDQLSHDFIELVEEDDVTIGHYIPHHAVHKDSETTPIRIVYDCSCKQGEDPSLNDCLEKGPILMNNLVEILIRFRLYPIAFTSDIEKAFLNVRLDEGDRNYTTFLWLSDPDNPESDFRVYRFKVVLFGSVSSPFILNAVIKTHLESQTSEVAEDLKNNIYVDNLLSGVTSEREAIAYYKSSVSTMEHGGFNLRAWASNNSKLRELAEKDGKQDKITTINVLGLKWKTMQTSFFSLHRNRTQTFIPKEKL